MRLLGFLISLLVFPLLSQADTRLLRFPDIHGDKVTFVYAGDIYIAPVSGGVAQRLTSHEGRELFPKFSPDGSRIAFSAEYNGTRQVYVMPAAGGAPRQLTWYNDVGAMPPRGGFDYRVLDWTPDGENVLVRANRLPWGERMGRYYLVPADGGMEQPLEIPEAGGGMLSPDGTKVIYTPIDREFRTWKRYRGGRAQDVWIYDLENSRSEQLTTDRATDNQPLWVGEHIYYTSDRDYTLNLFRHEPAGEPTKVTDHSDFDVLWPSAGPNAIVYENGGWLYRFNPANGATKKLEITVTGDLPGRLPHFVDAAKFIQSQDISPDGKRAVFAARGEIFTVPATEGLTRNVTRTPAVREIHVTWSPDGRHVAYLSDATGEYELYVAPQDGTGEPRQVTRGGKIWRFQPVWSPDSRLLAFGDTDRRLQVVDVESGRITTADQSDFNTITDYSWAPDSRHLAYTKQNEATFASVWIYDHERGETRQLTADDSFEANPVFDPEGRYLYFLSSRDFDLTFSSLEFNYLVTDSTRVYAGLLNADQPALRRPENDEVSIGDEKPAGEKNEKAKEDEDEEVELVIDFEGFGSRVVALQDGGSDYRALSANAAGVFYLVGQGAESTLKFFDLESEEEKTVLKGIAGYQLAARGEKLLFRAGEKWGIADAKPDQKSDKGHLDFSALELKIDPRVERAQMYVDAWRILRDWFYDPGMHGMDWEAVRDKYRPLVEHVAHRADLDYIFGEIAGEMNAGHIYVQTGDQAGVERKEGGLLGAEFEKADGYFRVARIFPGEPWHAAFRSPLAEPGVEVSVGDYVLAVNGVSSSTVENFYELLENAGGEVVSLTVNDSPRERGARVVMVRTITSETNLRYLDWVESRARRVDELSGGRIGYVHLPNTAVPGQRELFKRFLPQTEKDAMIIDDRYNGGGFIPDRMIEIMARKPLNYWKRRGTPPLSTPVFAHVGPKAMLINGQSSSGGDALPYYFRKLELGPLIGTRTWGGLIGISGNPMLVDGGGILASTFRFMDTDGNWAVENEGVAPDIEVIDRPEAVARGEDPSLDYAVRYLLEELEKNPPSEPDAPPAPTEFPPES
ncbi:MAG: PDZ domain-containing protein [Xanthomonadales bacterium]|nr:PDZ domain-containing protein [Xanthomonadales bacterium]